MSTLSLSSLEAECDALQESIAVTFSSITLDSSRYSKTCDDLDAAASSLQVFRQELINSGSTLQDHPLRHVSVLTEAIKIAEQTEKIELSLNDLQDHLVAEDWIKAAEAIAVLRSPDLLQVMDNEFVVATIGFPPNSRIHHSCAVLKDVFEAKFKEAVESRNEIDITLYFKMFPLIGHETLGISLYSEFVSEIMRARFKAKSSTNAVTGIWEHLARILTAHSPIILKYYDKSHLRTVMQKLLIVCDVFVERGLEIWTEEMQVDRFIIADKVSPILEEDIKTLDAVIESLAATQYHHALLSRLMIHLLEDEEPDTEGNVEELPTAKADALLHEILENKYVPLETEFATFSIKNAMRVTEISSWVPATSSNVDDIFFILRKVLVRNLQCSSLQILKKLVSVVMSLLRNEMINELSRKMDASFSSNSSPASTIPAVYFVYLNDMDTSASYAARLKSELTTVLRDEDGFINTSLIEDHTENAAQFLNSEFSSLEESLYNLSKSRIVTLFNQLIRPKLRSLISETYKDVTYVLSEEAFANAEYLDVPRTRFESLWKSFFGQYQRNLTETNYEVLIGLALDVIIRSWEKQIMSMRFTELGSVRFDKDLRKIVSFLSDSNSASVVREKFVRLQQMAQVLLMDDVGPEVYAATPIAWRFSNAEFDAVASLKVP